MQLWTEHDQSYLSGSTLAIWIKLKCCLTIYLMIHSSISIPNNSIGWCRSYRSRAHPVPTLLDLSSHNHKRTRAPFRCVWFMATKLVHSLLAPTRKLYICPWRTSVGNTKFLIGPMRTRHSRWVLTTIVSRQSLLTTPSVAKSFGKIGHLGWKCFVGLCSKSATALIISSTRIHLKAQFNQLWSQTVISILL